MDKHAKRVEACWNMWNHLGKEEAYKLITERTGALPDYINEVLGHNNLKETLINKLTQDEYEYTLDYLPSLYDLGLKLEEMTKEQKEILEEVLIIVKGEEDETN